MANIEHLNVLKQGAKIWNKWREDHPEIERPDLNDIEISILDNIDLDGINFKRTSLAGSKLSQVSLRGANLERANFIDADLSHVDFRDSIFDNTMMPRADLVGANFENTIIKEGIFTLADMQSCNLNGAQLNDAYFGSANLANAQMVGASLVNANLRRASLEKANLTHANLENANLSLTTMVETNLQYANLNNARVFGMSVWKINLDNSNQANLIITEDHKPKITVSNLEVAQFIYLLLNRAKLRDVISTITNKTVLILGRFYDERKIVLDTLGDALSERDYIPIIFDFIPSDNRDLTETIQLLANMSKFVIADLTDAKSLPQELSHIIPFLPSVPVQPIQLGNQNDTYAMFEHWEKYKSVLPVYYYEDKNHLINNMEHSILKPIREWKSNKDDNSDKDKIIEEKNKTINDLKEIIYDLKEIIYDLKKTNTN